MTEFPLVVKAIYGGATLILRNYQHAFINSLLLNLFRKVSGEARTVSINLGSEKFKNTIKRTTFILVISILAIAGTTLRGHEISDNSMNQLEYLYARHDDTRLMKIACAKALKNDATGAFYVGALYSEPESMYFRPRAGFMWLTIAESLGSELARPFISFSFPNLSQSEILKNANKAKECVTSNYRNCQASDERAFDNELGWPPEAIFQCRNISFSKE